LLSSVKVLPAGATAEDLYEVKSGKGHDYLQEWIDDMTDASKMMQRRSLFGRKADIRERICKEQLGLGSSSTDGRLLVFITLLQENRSKFVC
jgi:hypothetical protein